MRETPQQKYKNLGVVTTPFGGSTRGEARHPGVDIANNMGTPVKSTVSGRVVSKADGKVQGDKNLGNFVTVEDGQGNRHWYSHLKRGYVNVGDTVKKGQPLGEMGNSGAAYSKSGQGDGTHLDYRIVDAYGKYKNPMNFIKNLS